MSDELNASSMMLLTRAEAIALVKRSERERARICLAVSVDTPIVDEEGKPTETYFPKGGHSWLRLSRKDALHIVSDMLSETLERRGARIPVRTHVTRLIGDKRATTTYWIG